MNIARFTTCSLRLQLILAVAMVHMVLMSLFIWDLTRRQQDLLLQRQEEQALALARTLATSSAGWVAARDLAGLEELVNAQQAYPELTWAMLLDRRGLVLAHTDPKYLGFFLQDLPLASRDTTLVRTPLLVEVMVPVRLAQGQVGWARVGIDQRVARAKLDDITRDGLYYALAAILIGSLLAWLMGNRLTAKLHAVRRASEAVRGGSPGARVPDLGDDEVGRLARDFNAMLDALAAARGELDLSEERFRLAVGATQTGLWDWDLRSNRVFFSREWKAQVGCGEDEFGDRYEDWESLLHPEDREATLAALDECRRHPGHPCDIEFRLRHKDSSWRWINARGEVLLDAGGQPYRMLGTQVDVTEHKLAQAENEQLLRQMQQMQKMEALGQLTGGVAHDFNNILGVMLGYTQLVFECGKTRLPADALEGLEEVRRAGERARDLIAKMLTFARGGQGTADVLDPAPLVHEVARMLAATLPSSIGLSVNAEDDLPPVLVDPVELHQCVTNLCLNARDALQGQGCIEVTLRDARDRPPRECHACHQLFSGDFVELSVTDDGPGMSPEVLERIFDPFFTTKAVGRGTGMGLAVVMGIMKKIGGHIIVESRPGKGSSFRLYYPLTTRAPAAESPATPCLTAPLTGRSRRVLVVDDEVALGQLLARALEGHGYTVSLHHDPCAAREAFRADPGGFDALVSDQTMPGLTGLELIHSLRELKPDLPVVLLSGYSEVVDEQSAKQLGVRHFLSKPMHITELFEALRLQLE